MVCPLAFLRALERVRTCLERESPTFSSAELATRAGIRADICAAAIANLLHAGVVKVEDEMIVRADAVMSTRRRTA
jgi:hypothetical protein